MLESLTCGRANLTARLYTCAAVMGSKKYTRQVPVRVYNGWPMTYLERRHVTGTPSEGRFKIHACKNGIPRILDDDGASDKTVMCGERNASRCYA